MKSKQPTGPKRSEVAAEAKVSAYTVSLVLRNLPGVSAERRDRVLAAARKLGYRINPVASLLALQKGQTSQKLPRVALLGEGNFDIPSLLQEAGAQGLEIVHRKPSAYPSAEAASRQLWHEGVVGLLIDFHEWPWSLEETLRFAWDKFANVKFSRQFPELRFHVVRLSPFDYINAAIAKVVQAGYKNIGITLLDQSGSEIDDDARWGALLNWQHRKLDSSVKLNPLRLGNFSGAEELRQQARWLDTIKPEALILYHWFQYGPLINSYPKAKLKRIAICSILSSKEPLPEGMVISGLDINKQETNARACQLMKHLLAHGEFGPRALASEIVIRPQWIAGDTFPSKAKA